MTGSWLRVATAARDGEHLAVWRGPGSGRPVVAVHGAEDSWRSWRPLAERTADRYCLYSLDLPWRGGGGYGWGHRATAADWVASALELVPEPVEAVVAHSFGANAMLEHLARPSGRAPQPAAAVLLAPSYLPPALPVTPELYDHALLAFRRVLGEGIRLRMGSRADRVQPSLLDAMVDSTVDRVGEAGLRALFRQFVGTSDLVLGRVTVPTLVLAGENDEALPIERADALARAMPAAAVFLRPALTHFCHTEQVDDVAAELIGFLGRVLRPDHRMSVIR